MPCHWLSDYPPAYSSLTPPFLPVPPPPYVRRPFRRISRRRHDTLAARVGTPPRSRLSRFGDGVVTLSSSVRVRAIFVRPLSVRRRPIRLRVLHGSVLGNRSLDNAKVSWSAKEVWPRTTTTFSENVDHQVIFHLSAFFFLDAYSITSVFFSTSPKSDPS